MNVEFWQKVLTPAFSPATTRVEDDEYGINVTVSSRDRHCAVRLPLEEQEQPDPQRVVEEMRQSMADDWLGVRG